MIHRVRPTLFVFKNMNVPPLLSHIRSFSFLFVFFRSFFRSCVFLPFRSRARSFVRRTNPRAFCFVSFRCVRATRRVFDVFTSLFFRSSASPRGGKKREEKGVETSKTRPRGAGRFSRPKRGEDDDDARERARGARTTVERPVADAPRVFDETLIDEKRNENKHAPRAPRSRANEGWFSFVRSFEGVVGWG
jgi:hypothetical protein